MTLIRNIYQYNRNGVFKKIVTKGELAYYSQKAQAPLFKDLEGSFPTKYISENVESGWFKWWETNKYFPSYSVKESENVRQFSMVLPPPNVTGDLHMGHALTVVIQDVLARRNRMLHNEVLWVPGCDHAGIATQVIVEKILQAERNVSRHDIGRDAFVSEATNWKNVKIKNIYKQLRALGASLDYDKSCFTMDECFNKAVTTVFIRLFEEGYIYRNVKLVNWCCHLQSVISDIEVEHMNLEGKTKLKVPGYSDPVEFGILDYFAYPTLEGDYEIVVATTRLETMLGDVAVAVHPEDKRYAGFVGKQVIHPVTQEILPVISDDVVDANFGTGAVKITPGHDQLDYEIASRHNLKPKTIFDHNGSLYGTSSEFDGLNRFEVRKRLREFLISKNLHRDIKPHPTSLPLCSRTGDVVEKLFKPQWFLKCEEFASSAIQVVSNDLIKFHPSYNSKVWNSWLSSAQEWCISRQLWWGHRLPIYLVLKADQKEEWVAGNNYEDALKKAQEKFGTDIKIKQDEDVLDTWFSSAIFPLVALGWSNQTSKIEKFYPLSLMETGHDILFFWVARMVMLCQYVTGEIPFKQVLLHGMVCDSSGKKMSKSTGNVLDPMDIIYGKSQEELISGLEKSHQEGLLSDVESAIKRINTSYPEGIRACGADALRLYLASLNSQLDSFSVDIHSILKSHNFGNKIWQSCRFYLGHKTKHGISTCFVTPNTNRTNMLDIDQYILSRLSTLVNSCNEAFQDHKLHLAVKAIQEFWIRDYCDLYIEAVKLRNNDPLITSRIMATCIYTYLKLICPVMPFIAEELYHRLFIEQFPEKSITMASYPSNKEWEKWKNDELEQLFIYVDILISRIRGLKVEYEIDSKGGSAKVSVLAPEVLCRVKQQSDVIKQLSRLKDLEINDSDIDITAGGVFSAIDQNIKLVLAVDEAKIIKHSAKIKAKITKIEAELGKLSKTTEKPRYAQKTPAYIQKAHLQKRTFYEEQLKQLRFSLPKK